MKNSLQLIVLLILPLSVFAQLPTAEDVIRKNLATAEGFVDSLEEVRMVLRTDDGKEDIREITIRTLELTEEGDKSLIVFNNPPDVKGSSVLTHSHIKEDDDQWIYLPALKRVKRISSSNKSGPFMGSEIAYEDLSSNELKKFNYISIKKEKQDGDGREYFLVEKEPAYKNSGYSKIIDYIGVDDFLIYKSIRYDENGKLYKTVTFENYLKYTDSIWRARKIQFSNHQNNKSTDLVWPEKINFKNGFTERDFDKSVMKRLN